MTNIRVEHDDLNSETVLLKPMELLDIHQATVIIKELSDALKTGCKYALLDMTDVGFISSGGVGAIAGNVERFRNAGGDVMLCNVSDSVRRVLKLLDLDDYVTITESVSQGIEKVKSYSPEPVSAG